MAKVPRGVRTGHRHNPNARLQGNVLTDEKVMGTVHIAIGHNALASYGGQNVAPIHLDV